MGARLLGVHAQPPSTERAHETGRAIRPSGGLPDCLAYVAVWLIVEPHSLNWHGAATVATWLMTLFIQRAEHRDTQAIQAKLDEVLRALNAADDSLRNIDEQEPEDIEAIRDERA
jgi:low affinity Fe/Cu permease